MKIWRHTYVPVDEQTRENTAYRHKEYCSGLKCKGILSFAIISLDEIILNEKSPAKKDTNCMILFICGI